MNESISRLMDGEVDASELDGVCATLKTESALATWDCYHTIGDALRGDFLITRSLFAGVRHRLADEPTVLAPGRPIGSRPASWALAAAATLAAVSVVGWTAYSMVDAAPAGLARAGEAGTMRAAEIRAASIPADYVLAHQEYAPANALQGAGPYLRDVAATGDLRP